MTAVSAPQLPRTWLDNVREHGNVVCVGAPSPVNADERVLEAANGRGIDPGEESHQDIEAMQLTQALDDVNHFAKHSRPLLNQ